ncbi:MAG: 4'-phosphopantetheinyl transferase superfamily protein [Anaerolineae bacterium]|nr:4'-phosphopantetheinyl transferase superfamily protein [Anaerolineae bacterium]
MTPFAFWSYPPEILNLSQDEIHIWRASLDVEPSWVQDLQQILSPDEQARAARFHFEKDREHYIVARGLLRIILGRYLEMEPHELSFSYGPYGKPGLTTLLGHNVLNFNMSHSHGLAIYGFTRGRKIGVDLERIHTDFACEQIAKRFFTPNEFAILHALPAEMKHEAFFNCWTRKEAYIKARGQGLSFSLNQFEVSFTPGEPAKLLNIAEDPYEAARWSLVELEPDPCFAAALAVEGHDWQLSCWHWLEY